MSFFFIIFIITFLCPFVSALLPDNDYSIELFSGYFDLLISSAFPFIAFLIVDYDYDEEGSKGVAQLVRSLIYFVIVGMQQELAFKFSSVEISNSIKILQHVVVALLLIGIIGEFRLFFETGETKFNPGEKKELNKILISGNNDEYMRIKVGKSANYILTLFIVDYITLILFIILLGLWLNDLKEIITLSFILSLVISFLIISFIQSLIIIVAKSKQRLDNYINNHNQIYGQIFPSGYHAYITIFIDNVIITNMLYFPSLINYFLMQTPNLFNNIFLNLTALFVSSWIILLYKTILKNEGMDMKNKKGENERRNVTEDEVASGSSFQL
jgi:hypothetical protein